MTREDIKVEFAGLTHDHLMVNKQDIVQSQQQQQQTQQQLHQTNGNNNSNNLTNADHKNAAPALSTIAILRRHPMYDSLVLVKKYRTCLNGYSLEFPTSDVTSKRINKGQQQQHQDCFKTKLVTKYLDGDDPMYQCQERRHDSGLLSPEGEIVYVPMNGLLDRLDTYDRHGISIDSRVYAFAMGLKTAEKFLTTSSMKELQETPPI